jgi:hypothetical protein
MIYVLLVFLAFAVGHVAASEIRFFAYMDARNEDGSMKRSHVYALSTAGTLAHRFTSKIEEWRSVTNGDAPLRYSKTLAFPSPAERSKNLLNLYYAIDDYNRLTTMIFETQGKTTPPNHLIVMREQFGPEYEESNQYVPTKQELNSLHDQFAKLLGPGGGSRVSPVWGNWTELLENEISNSHGVDPNLQRRENNLVIRIRGLLNDINTLIHATEAMSPWSIRNRFTFNVLNFGSGYEPFLDEDYEPDRWRMALEMGGLYMAYTKTGKNLLVIAVDDDIDSLKNNAELNTILFQEGFSARLYAVWSLANDTEANKQTILKDFWQKHDITNKYGFVWGNRSEPNGYIRLGQQVCYPPSDCDRPWVDLLDEFSETPIVDDIRFSREWPYGDGDENRLRFLYPGDEMFLEEQAIATHGFLFRDFTNEILNSVLRRISQSANGDTNGTNEEL